MNRDEEAKPLRLFDIRTVERNIRKGLITRKDYEKHLKSLEDVSEKIAPKEAHNAPGGIAGPGTATQIIRPVEYTATPIIAHPPAPGSAELRMDDDIDDDDDDDLEELDDDDLEPVSNGAGEEPPQS